MVTKYPNRRFRNPYEEQVVSEIVCQVYTEEENLHHMAQRAKHLLQEISWQVIFSFSRNSHVISPSDIHLILNLNKFLLGEWYFSGEVVQTLSPIPGGRLQRHFNEDWAYPMTGATIPQLFCWEIARRYCICFDVSLCLLKKEKKNFLTSLMTSKIFATSSFKNS